MGNGLDSSKKISPTLLKHHHRTNNQGRESCHSVVDPQAPSAKGEKPGHETTEQTTHFCRECQ